MRRWLNLVKAHAWKKLFGKKFYQKPKSKTWEKTMYYLAVAR